MLLKRLSVLALACTLLAACDTWFGAAKGPPLQGERISVLEHQTKLTPEVQGRTDTVALPAAVANVDWPQAGGNSAHSMYNLQAGNIAKPAWTASIGEGADDERPWLASPVAARGRVFTLDSENVASAFDARTGKRLWQVDLARTEDDYDAESGGISYDEGRLFITTGFSKVIALDADNGSRVWRRNVGFPVHAAPTAADGRVFVITVENQLFALNASDGTDAWPPYQAMSETAKLLGSANPAVANGVVVAPFSSGDLVALRADTGRVLWSDSLAPARRTDELSALAQIRARPVIDGDRVYAMSVGGILAAFDLRNGQRLWDRDIGGLSMPWIAGRQLFVITNESDLLCISADTGRIIWVTALPRFENEKKRTEPILWSGPVMLRDRLFVVSGDGRMMAVSPYDGRIIDRRTFDEGLPVAPIVADGTVFIVDASGYLSAYH